MPGGAKTLQEYLVSLGVKIDEKGMTKMEGFLKSSKMGFMALAGIMVAGATVATKWVKQMNEAEIALEKQAKAQHKSIESVRASENALKALGKTKQEVAKDKSLKVIYDDLVKMNKAMALPDGSRGLTLVKSIAGEFYKFKSTIQYAMQWVNYHIITKLEGPLTRIRDTMQKWREKLTGEMPLWTAKIANGLSVFVRLLETGIRAGGQLIQFIQNLPKEIKVMGTAMLGLWSIIRAGPLGWLLGGLTMLFLLLDDFYAYQRGEKSALSGLWEGLDDGSFGDKIVSMAQGGINDFVTFMKSSEVQNALKEVVTILLDVVTALIDGAVAILMKSLPKNIQDFLGWDPDSNDGKGGWKLDERDVAVESKGQNTVVEQGTTIPSKYPGVVYQNTNGILNPVLAPEYDKMPYDQVPKSVTDSLKYLVANLFKGFPPLFESEEYTPTPTTTDEERSKRDDEIYQMLKGMLEGKESDAKLVYSDFYKNLKDAFGIEQGLFENGESSQEYFKGITDALLKGAVKDYIASMSPYGSSQNGYQYNQWYEAYKKGELVPKENDSKYGPDGDIEVHYDPTQVSQATQGAIDVAQGAVNPVYVPIIPEYGPDGDVEVHYDPNGGPKRNALGGRYDKPVASTLAEDGDAEYVIPIKKLGRAIPLIRMMLAEMGDKARDALAGFGVGPDTDLNQLVESKGLGVPGGRSPIINVVNNNTVHAPATIIVNGAGQDPQAVGQATYNAQERFLVRTLKGAIQSE